jgi:hypothetical protein
MRSATVVLPVPGLPVRRRARLQAFASAELVDQQQRGNVADAALHRRQTHQLGVEAFQDSARTGRLEQRLGRGCLVGNRQWEERHAQRPESGRSRA